MAVQEAVNQTIVNQEQGKCPIETTNILSRAKIYDMKKLKVPETVRNYANLYQDSIVASQYHELQKFGQRSEGLRNTVKGATYVKIDHEAQNQEQIQNMQQQQQQYINNDPNASSDFSDDSPSSDDNNQYEQSNTVKQVNVSMKEDNIKEGDLLMIQGEPCIIDKIKKKQFTEDGQDHYKSMKIKGKHVLTNKKFREKFVEAKELTAPVYNYHRAIVHEINEEGQISYEWVKSEKDAEQNEEAKLTAKLSVPKKQQEAQQLVTDVQDKIKKEGKVEVELAIWANNARLFHLY